MKFLASVILLASGVICSFATIEERISDLETVVQGQFAENEQMRDRLKELEQEVAELVEEESESYLDDQRLTEKRDIPLNGLPGHLLTRAVSSSRVFHAYLSTTKCYNDYVKIIFDAEAYDDSNWYDARDGIYEARESGVYVFTWTVAAPPNTRVTTELIVGGAMKGVITTDSDKPSNDGTGSGLHPATAVVVVNMSVGDHCYIRVRHQTQPCLNILSNANSVLSTFSGWKLY